MQTFKSFLESTSVMSPALLAKLISAAASRTPRPYVYLEYEGRHIEGFLEDATLNRAGYVTVDYREWSTDEGTYIPATFVIYPEDIDRFYFGQFDGRRTLMLREPVSESREVYAQKVEAAPDWAPEHAEGDYRVGSVTFSAANGLGAVPFNQSVYYHGLVAECRPSTFLELALPHGRERLGAAQDIVKLVKDGYALGIPWLDLSLKDTVEHDGHPRITGHEGRGRMLAIKQLIGDVPVPIHLILSGGMRARHLDDRLIAAIKEGVYSQDGQSVVTKPFSALYVKGKKV